MLYYVTSFLSVMRYPPSFLTRNIRIFYTYIIFNIQSLILSVRPFAERRVHGRSRQRES